MTSDNFSKREYQEEHDSTKITFIKRTLDKIDGEVLKAFLKQCVDLIALTEKLREKYGGQMFFLEHIAFGSVGFVVVGAELEDGYTWPTTEHYWQAHKFISNETHYLNVLKLFNAREAFNYVRTYKFFVRSDWPDVEDEIIFKACVAKFQQHQECKQLLLLTSNRILVEHTENDSYWGDEDNGSRKNQLGITLMRVRDALRK
ncbi:unnamed protein product [Adineta steineri]|uniref:NADAR domain-containing protein n=1 Tax=Adineta steineri TaxID=433720 RepID=A0A815P0Z9_9BILA|nr:unnamed protein product [Adineta steineri]